MEDVASQEAWAFYFIDNVKSPGKVLYSRIRQAR